MFNTFDPDALYAVDAEELDRTPSKNGRSRLILWLIATSLAGLLLPLYLIAISIDTANATLASELVAISTELATTPEPAPEQDESQATLTRLRTQLNDLQRVLSTITVQAIDWPLLMATIGNFDQYQITINNLVQNDDRIVLSGIATTEGAVVAYSRTLEDSGLFSRVHVQSITLEAGKENTTFQVEFTLMLEVSINAPESE